MEKESNGSMRQHRFVLDVGLRMRRACKSTRFEKENGLELKFTPSEEHQAFPGMVNGGIIGTLLDCHGN